MASLKPRQSAIWAFVGSRSTALPRQITTGISETSMLKPVEQLLRLVIAIQIEVVKRMAVPRQEFAHPKRPGAVHRSDDDDVAEVAGDQAQAAQDERPHQDLAQLGVGLDHGEQLLAIELDHLARLAHLQACDRRGGR